MHFECVEYVPEVYSLIDFAWEIGEVDESPEPGSGGETGGGGGPCDVGPGTYQYFLDPASAVCTDQYCSGTPYKCTWELVSVTALVSGDAEGCVKIDFLNENTLVFTVNDRCCPATDFTIEVTRRWECIFYGPGGPFRCMGPLPEDCEDIWSGTWEVCCP